jgi:hypothetical protein
MPNQIKKSRLKKTSVLKAIAWLPAMVAWPVFLLYLSVWVNLTSAATAWLLLIPIGWIVITYLCIGNKSAVALVLFFAAFYISPLPMYNLKAGLDCGSIPDWKCRWTCKSRVELIDLGIGHHDISNDFWYDNPDITKVGGFCDVHRIACHMDGGAYDVLC